MTANLSELVQAAAKHLENDRVKEADSLYTEVLRQNPAHVEALNGRGLILLKTGDVKAAYECFTTALAVDPASLDSTENLGLVYLAQDKPDDAQTCFESVIQRDPERHRVQLNLAILEARTKGLESAIRSLRALVEGKPDYAAAHYNLGTLLAQAGQADQAVWHLRRAAELQPDDVEILTNLGLATLDKGEADEAVGYLERARLGAPFDPMVLSALAHGLVRVGRAEEAEPLARQATTLQPKLPAAQAAFGAALLALGKADAGRAKLRQAHRLAPKDPGIAMTFAKALYDSGRRDEAFAPLEAVADASPQAAMLVGELRLARNDAEKDDHAKGWALLAAQFPPGMPDFPFLEALPKASEPEATGDAEDQTEPTETDVETAAEVPATDPPLADLALVVLAAADPRSTVLCLRHLARLAALGAKTRVATDPTFAELVRLVPGLEENDPESPPADGEALTPIERLPHLLAEAGLAGPAPEETKGSYLVPSTEEIEAWRNRLDALAKPVIGLAWPPAEHAGPDAEFLGAILAEWARNHRAEGALLGTWLDIGPGEPPRELAQALEARRLEAVHPVTSLPELAAALTSFDLIVGPDCLPLHIAGALGKPGLSLDHARAHWSAKGEGPAPWYPSLLRITPVESTIPASPTNGEADDQKPADNGAVAKESPQEGEIMVSWNLAPLDGLLAKVRPGYDA